mmetsp:Transcript_84083/g.238535  ORF Transcript_84083/g.238535 Transcript_84083/m.238535 type:complete len:229 (-) Transcript_84083:418-1104(-)
MAAATALRHSAGAAHLTPWRRRASPRRCRSGGSLAPLARPHTSDAVVAGVAAVVAVASGTGVATDASSSGEHPGPGSAPRPPGGAPSAAAGAPRISTSRAGAPGFGFTTLRRKQTKQASDSPRAKTVAPPIRKMSSSSSSSDSGSTGVTVMKRSCWPGGCQDTVERLRFQCQPAGGQIRSLRKSSPMTLWMLTRRGSPAWAGMKPVFMTSSRAMSSGGEYELTHWYES